MAASLRGQLGVKSSPLAPTSSKLTTQMLVISHMENHYKKINKARPAIDNGRPKSMVSSQKLRDRKNRKIIEKYGSRPGSRMTYRPESADGDIYDERQWDEPEDEEERQVHDIMRTTLRVPLKAQHGIGSMDATDGSKTESGRFGTTTMRPQSATLRGMTQTIQGRPRPMSARSTTSLASNYSQTSRSTNPLKVTYDGDVLSKHAHNFTEPSKPFTPRTLKSNRESSLKRYKYYTPPPPKSAGGTKGPGPGDQPSENGDTSVKEAPLAKPRQRAAKGGGRGGADLGATETLTETMLMDMSLQSHDPRQRGDGSGVPRLDISMDKDHLNWMQEQATRAQHRARNGTAGPPPSQPAGSQLPDDGGDTCEQKGTQGGTDTLRFTRTISSSKSFGVKSPTSRRLGQAEEEQKYVAFAHEVTQDIISRSISSDRVLQKVFERHMEKRKGELDERRMRAIINDIRRDLDIKHVGPVNNERVHYSSDLEETTGKSTHDGDEMEQTGTTEGGGLTATDTMASGNSTLSTMNNTYNFNRTTDVFSTIHSLPEEEEDLSATQALRQYQMDLTVKDNAEEYEQASGVASELDQTLTTDNNGGTLRSTAKGFGSGDEEKSVAEESSVGEVPRPATRPRPMARHAASTSGQQEQNTSRRTSLADTDARTEEEVEEEVEEEYEDDYDADEDDGTQRGSDDDF